MVAWISSSRKFPGAFRGETLSRPKKLGRNKDGTDLFYHHGEYGGARSAYAPDII